jgi:hypothetical protein
VVLDALSAKKAAIARPEDVEPSLPPARIDDAA